MCMMYCINIYGMLKFLYCSFFSVFSDIENITTLPLESSGMNGYSY